MDRSAPGLTRGVQCGLHGIGVVGHAIPTRTKPEDVVFGRRPGIWPTDAQGFQTAPPSRRTSTPIVHPDGVFADGQVCRQRRAR